jgi:hypothetical protein
VGEAKRRKASQQWDNDLLQIHNQAKGVLDVYIVHTHDAFRLLRASISGNQNATAIMRAIRSLRRRRDQGSHNTKASTLPLLPTPNHRPHPMHLLHHHPQRR